MARPADDRPAVLSRRQLLERATFLAGATILAACGGTAPATSTPQPTTTRAPAPVATTAPGGAATPAGAAASPTRAAGGGTPAGAASPPAGAAALPGKRGGKLTWALESDPSNLIPYGGVSTSNMWGKEFMYDSLLEWDKDLNIKPALAESFEAPDDKTYVFHLRKGVKFHDGKELDAEDVKYSLEQQANPPSPGVKSTFVNLSSADVVDKYTIKVNMAKADPTVPGILAWSRYTPIVPKGIYDRLNMLSQGIGTGPFKLVEFVPNDRVVYTRNPDFWKPGLPYLDDLTLKVLPDEQARVAALRSGAIDGGTFSSDIAQTLKNDRTVSVLTGLVAAPRVIQFTMKAERKPWHDVKVRQAINAAVNRQLIIDNVYGGEAELTGPIPPGYGDWFIPASELAARYYKYDVNAAKKLMADAGMSSGFSVTLQAIAAPRDYTQIAEIVREQLKQININVTVQPLEIGTFAKNIGAGDFEWASTGRGMRGDPSGFVNDFRGPSANYDSWFKGGWENAELAKLYDDALVIVDQAKRKPMYRRIQEIILEEVPNLYTVQNKKFQAVRSRVKNMYVSYTDFNSGLREAWVEG